MSGKGRIGAFTLLEVMVAVVILAIVASMATAGYTRSRDQAILQKDKTNLLVSHAALKLFLYNNDSLPGSLSDLKPEYWNRAYAQLHTAKTPPIWVAFLRNWIGEGVAQAGENPPGKENKDKDKRPSWDPDAKYLGVNPWQTLTCLADKTPPPPPGISYALALPGFSRKAFEDPANADRTLVVESDDGVTKVYRHGGGKICPTVTVSGKIVLEER